MKKLCLVLLLFCSSVSGARGGNASADIGQQIFNDITDGLVDLYSPTTLYGGTAQYCSSIGNKVRRIYGQHEYLEARDVAAMALLSGFGAFSVPFVIVAGACIKTGQNSWSVLTKIGKVPMRALNPFWGLSRAMGGAAGLSPGFTQMASVKEGTLKSLVLVSGSAALATYCVYKLYQEMRGSRKEADDETAL